MKSYLDEINDRLAVVDLSAEDLPKPTGEIKYEHTPLGTLGEKGQKMFVVWQDFKDEHKKLDQKIFNGENWPNLDKETAREHSDLCDLAGIAKKFFWSEVHKEFLAAIGDNNCLSVIEGFNVVASKKEIEEKPFNPFEGMEGVEVITIGIDGPSIFNMMRGE